MAVVKTRVIGPIEENLQEQAKARGMTLYRYAQVILTEVGRGNIRLVAEVTVKEVGAGRNCTCGSPLCRA